MLHSELRTGNKTIFFTNSGMDLLVNFTLEKTQRSPRQQEKNRPLIWKDSAVFIKNFFLRVQIV